MTDKTERKLESNMSLEETSGTQNYPITTEKDFNKSQPAEIREISAMGGEKIISVTCCRSHVPPTESPRHGWKLNCILRA